ncbi:Mpp10 [Gregarina niphandrodes]|uniref:Mpp10 n=1 Tax=Gregarina niphandrodes TaxID=110365 RepID=A0A023B6K6_GRENI|nr:Mpp10 [Gregarina niphandrodes]EZG66587.1 Mpp10 [Gregarina niphandrodes]|eukprot:XP_011130596.1 Mpp10 [Gregarina niphandrodes]
MSLRDLERELVSERHWTLRGEVTSTERPQDSILEEGALEFRTSSRVHNDAVQVDEETGARVERDVDSIILSIIKKRVGMRLYDDVDVQTIVTDENAADADKTTLKEVLDSVDISKPTKSLAEEYVGMVVTDTGATINVQEAEKKAQQLWNALSHKLDQYCIG